MKTPILQTTIILAMLPMFFSFISCEKDHEIKPDKISLLTDGTWKISSLMVEPAIDWFGTPVTNVYAQLPECVRDNLTIFKSNGTVNFDEGPSKCDPNEPQTITGSWAFNPDQTILSLTSEGETESWKITRLDGLAITAQYEENHEGVNYTFSIHLVNK